MCFILFVIIARSLVYAAKLIVYCDALSVYLRLPRSNHLSSGSRDMIKRYGLSVSPRMVLHCMWTNLVLPKYEPENIVVELE